MELPEDPPLPLNDPCAGRVVDMARILGKIKAASLRVGFNLWSIFKEVDDYRTNYVSESKFLSVFLGPLKNIIGLDAEDLETMSTKFKAKDGRIAYTQLCRLIHNDQERPAETEVDKDRENQYLSNTLSPAEEERASELLSRIAATVPPQKMLTKPFFQDYELIRRGSGHLTKNTFAKVLDFVGVHLEPCEFQVLFSKYRYDAFTVKYNAFLKELNAIYQYFAEHGYLDTNGNFRGKPNEFFVPRPELKAAPRGPEFGIMKVWKDNVLGQMLGFQAALAFNKIKEHVRRERLRVADFFKTFDEDDAGRVDKLIFEKGVLEWISVSELAFNNLYVSPSEMKLLCDIYQDPYYKDKILWKVFMDDIERDIPEEELKSWPCRGPERIPVNPFVVLHRPPSPPPRYDTTLEETLEHIRECMESNPESRTLKSVLNKYARQSDDGTVSPRQFEWAFIKCGILMNHSMKQQLWMAYDTGEDSIDINSFYEDLFRQKEFKPRNQLSLIKEETEKNDKLMEEMRQTNIVEVLAKIKSNAICKRIWLRDSLKQFDKFNKQLITREEFKRGIGNCGISLTELEMETVLDVFALPENPSLIEYMRFCRTVDEDSLPQCINRIPLKELMAKEEAKEKQALPKHQYVNFDERLALGNAMDKLVKHVKISDTDFFKSLDKNNSGTVNKLDFKRALQKLNCLHLITNREVDVIVDSFGITKDLNVELDYMAFLHALDIIHKTQKAAKTA